MWINIVLFGLFVLLGAKGGLGVLLLFFIPFGTLYFERNLINKINENKIKIVRICLIVLNIITFMVAVYNLLLIVSLFVLL